MFVPTSLLVKETLLAFKNSLSFIHQGQVFVEYTITFEESGDVVISEREVIFLVNQTSFEKVFTIPIDADKGVYLFNVQISNPDAVASASSFFTVRSPSSLPLWIQVQRGWIIIIIIVYIVYKIINRTRKKKGEKSKNPNIPEKVKKIKKKTIKKVEKPIVKPKVPPKAESK